MTMLPLVRGTGRKLTSVVVRPYSIVARIGTSAQVRSHDLGVGFVGGIPL
jgi:hypothetical protein